MPPWATYQTYVLGGPAAKGRFLGKVVFLDGYNSVGKVCEDLNAGKIKCEAGCCVVWSATKDSYYLLWKAGFDKVALGLFGLVPSPVPGGEPMPMQPHTQARSTTTTTTFTSGTASGFSSSSSETARTVERLLGRTASPMSALENDRRGRGNGYEVASTTFVSAADNRARGRATNGTGAWQDHDLFGRTASPMQSALENGRRGRGGEPAPATMVAKATGTTFVSTADNRTSGRTTNGTGSFIKSAVIQRRLPDVTTRLGSEHRASSAPPYLGTRTTTTIL